MSCNFPGSSVYPPTIAWAIGAGAYVMFMLFLDVPMYWSRWLADRKSGHRANDSRGPGDALIWRKRRPTANLTEWGS